MINDSLDAGSQLCWVQRAHREGYSVVILNPNDGSRQVASKSIPIRVRIFADRRSEYECLYTGNCHRIRVGWMGGKKIDASETPDASMIPPSIPVLRLNL